ncbi:MAG: dockerin type I repeat-containing protein [Clostridia bacterium]|nr:dockerin type I repeat-containing protein [Clostridia bacterium]
MKKLLSLILTITLILGALPLTLVNVVAEEEIYFEKDHDGAYLIDNYAELKRAAEIASASVMFRLQKDIIVNDSINNNNIVVDNMGFFKLDLNGYTLSRTANSLDTSLITIKNETSMYVCDTSMDESGTIKFSNSNNASSYKIFHLQNGNLVIESGNYGIIAPNSMSESSIVFAEQGNVEIYDGYFDASKSNGGAIVELLHMAYMYDLPSCTIHDGVFYAKCHILSAAYGSYTKYGCFYPNVTVLGGMFHNVSATGNTFSYCNNGYGTVIVAGGTIPVSNTNANQRSFLKGARLELTTVKNPDGVDIPCYEVNTPPFISTMNKATEDDLQERMEYAINQTFLDYYRNYKNLQEYYPEEFEILDKPYVLTIPYNMKNCPEVFTRGNSGKEKKTEWYTATEYAGKDTVWTLMPELTGAFGWTPDRPAEETTMPLRVVVTAANDKTYEDVVLLHFEELLPTYTIDELNLHISAPVMDKTPSDSVYISSDKDKYETSFVKWYNVTDGRTMSANETFKAGKVYKVTIGVETTEEQFEFDAVSNMKAYINGKKVEAVTISGEDPTYSLAAIYVFEPCSSLIKEVNLDVMPPVAGMSTGSVPNTLSDAYSIFDPSDIQWYDVTDNNRKMLLAEQFKDGHEYRTVFWVKANNGYEFDLTEDFDPNVKAYINGKVAVVDKAYDQFPEEVIEVEYNFGVCDSTVSRINILGIAPPVAGESPEITATVHKPEKYSIEKITWIGPEGPVIGDDTFIAGEEYQLEIKLVPAKVNGVNVCKFANNVDTYFNSEKPQGMEVYASQTQVYIYTTFTCVKANPAVKYGDVNGDGDINATDALLALHITVNKVIPNNAQITAADVDGNSEVNAADALLILHHTVGKITKFPVEA